jgi:hypothetical protein
VSNFMIKFRNHGQILRYTFGILILVLKTESSWLQRLVAHLGIVKTYGIGRAVMSRWFLMHIDCESLTKSVNIQKTICKPICGVMCKSF